MLGIVVWEGEQYALTLDDAAQARVIRDNPHLHRDALSFLEPMIRDRLSAYEGPVAQRLSRISLPVIITEPRFATVDESASMPLEADLNELVERVVHSRGRYGGAVNLVQLVERRLRPLIRARRVIAGYAVPSSRTGIPRSVDFYANSGANIALDMVKLAMRSADEIIRGADAEAFKIEDVVSQISDLLNRYVVLCEFSADKSFRSRTSRRATSSSQSREM
jgi:hypothetical protein